MKKLRLSIFVLCIILISGCSAIKTRQMKKDAVILIEASQKADSLHLFPGIEAFIDAIDKQYKGEERTVFVDILKSEIDVRNAKGENCGVIEMINVIDHY